MDPDSLNPDSGFLVNPDPDPDPGFDDQNSKFVTVVEKNIKK